MPYLNRFHLKKTKVICTIGPASCEVAKIIEMINAGMNAARFNCSHGDHRTLGGWIANVREASQETGIPIPIMLDLQGPKIRIGKMKGGKPIEVNPGHKLVITTKKVLGDSSRVSTEYKELPRAVRVGDHIFINDGLVRLRVEKKTETEIFTEVETNGIIANFKGINVPGGKFHRRGLTEKDQKDLAFGFKQQVSLIAVSFVERASDIRAVKKLTKEAGSRAKVIAKIERASALDNLKDILAASDGVMVARGDLGVEIKVQKVPITQKDIIQKAIERNRFTIVATQMLESMTHSAQPTRAEVSDVANSILDNTDGIMLSAETAMGINPAQAVKMMSKIALEVEGQRSEEKRISRRKKPAEIEITDAVTGAAIEAAESMGVDKIVVFTNTGKAALSLSLRRPSQRIFAFSPDSFTRLQIQMLHGVYPMEFPSVRSLDRMVAMMDKIGLEKDLWKVGEDLIMVSGPPGVSGGTNLLKIHRVTGK